MTGEQNIGSTARAQVAAMEYMQAKNELAGLKDALADEGGVLRTMKLLFVLTTIVVTVLLIRFGLFDLWRKEISELGYDLEGYDRTISIALTTFIYVLIVVGMVAWVGCYPAVFIGEVRALKRKGWFVGGGWVLFIFLFLLFVTIPILLGPFSFARQRFRVKRLKADVSAAESHLADVTVAIE